MRTTYTIPIEAFDNNPLEDKDITDALLDKLFDPINKNKIYIFETVGSIERMLDAIIGDYFYEPYKEVDKDFRNRFNSLVLSSDWCSFSAKRKLAIKIVNDFKLLVGKEKSDYETLLRDVMAYRNAFAHGETPTDGKIVKLRYYEGEPKCVLLDRSYFKKLEQTLNECFSVTHKIAKKIGVFKNNS